VLDLARLEQVGLLGSNRRRLAASRKALPSMRQDQVGAGMTNPSGGFDCGGGGHG
jgi:hypothetical protein